ncbi:MAG: polyamine aminopropyltransferase [Pseudomonadota bacterium]
MHATSVPAPVSARHTGVLLLSILIVALCGIVYELIIAAVSSYLLGNSVFQFSLTIGGFMFAMGLGSLVSKYFDDDYIRNFIIIEIAVALTGGLCSTLLFVMFPYARPLYEVTMYGLILVIGALVGMEIPILTAFLAKRTDLKESIANVLSLDYVGALIGSVAFPLILLPSLGLLQASFVIGLLNITIAIVNIYVFRAQLRHARLLAGAAVFTLLVLIGFVLAGNQITRFAEKNLYFDQVVFTKQTPYQKLVLTRSVLNPDERLYIDGHIQFSSRDEYRYHEFLVHPVMSPPGPRANVLILGGGDGLAAREVLKYPEVQRVDLVDIDPQMLSLASDLATIRRLNGDSMHDERVNAIAQDAFTFINQPGIAYDRVIIDMPDPHNEAINKLYSREFYTMIRRRMSAQGVLVTQSSSPFYTRNVYWSIESTLHDVFADTLSYHTALPSFGIWGFHLAGDRDDLGGPFEFSVPTRAITTASMAAASVFTTDLAQVDAPVNSIMEPVLYQIYIQDLRK